MCRVTAASLAEAKDGELERVLASNARLRQDLASTQHARMVRPGHALPSRLCVCTVASCCSMQL